MTISTGQQMPAATLIGFGPDGPHEVQLTDKLKGRKVALFGLPGAFTGVCSEAHMPSFVRSKPQFDAKGVDEVICVSVNDPFVLEKWGEATGATDAGITILADAASDLVKAIGLSFTAPPVGFYDRAKRFSMFIKDGEVKALNVEDSPGECAISAGETLLEQI